MLNIEEKERVVKNHKVLKNAVAASAVLTVSLLGSQVKADEDKVSVLPDTDSEVLVSPANSNRNVVEEAEKERLEKLTKAEEAEKLYQEQAKKTEEARVSLSAKEAQLASAKEQEERATRDWNNALNAAQKQKELAELGVVNTEEEIKKSQKLIEEVAAQDAETQEALKKAQVIQEEASKRFGKVASEVATAEKEVADAQAEVRRLTGTTAQFTKNTIVLNDDFRDAMRGYLRIHNEMVKKRNDDWAARKYKEDYSAFDKRLEAQIREILKVNTGVKTNNVYVSDEDTLADKTVYNVNNLPRKVVEELTFFYAELMNQVRKQVGTNQAVVATSAIDFAEKVAKGYIANKFGFTAREENLKKGGYGHDGKAINDAARSYNMEVTTPEEEAIGIQYYEIASSIGLHPSQVGYHKNYFITATLDELKEFTYKGALGMIGTANDWGHLRAYVGLLDEKDQAYVGASFSHGDDFTRLHMMSGIIDRTLENSTNFNRTVLQNPYTNKANEIALEKARKALSQKETDLKKAKEILDAEAYNVKTAQQTVTGFEKRKGILTTAQKELEKAKQRHELALAHLKQSQKEEAALKASAEAHFQKIAELRTEIAKAQEDYNKALDTLDEVQENFYKLHDQFEEAKKAFEDADKLRAEAMKSWEVLNKQKEPYLRKREDGSTYYDATGAEELFDKELKAYNDFAAKRYEASNLEQVYGELEGKVGEATELVAENSQKVSVAEQKMLDLQNELADLETNEEFQDLPRKLQKIHEDVLGFEIIIEKAKAEIEDAEEDVQVESQKKKDKQVELLRLEEAKNRAKILLEQLKKEVGEQEELVKSESTLEKVRKETALKLLKEANAPLSAVPATAPVQEELPFATLPPLLEEPIRPWEPVERPAPVFHRPVLEQKTEQTQLVNPKQAKKTDEMPQVSHMVVQGKTLPNTGTKANTLFMYLGLAMSVLTLSYRRVKK